MNKHRVNISLWILYLLIICGVLVTAGESNGAGSFKQEELDQMLAPIALYPDSLLAQIFMASTYPLEVVQANNWIKENNDLNSTDLSAALEQKRWDPSVKSLVNFPDVLQMMSDKLDYTQRLGDAFLSQQKDVMDTVQKLRRKAMEQGNLKTGDEQTVTDNDQVITIESSDPETVTVPYYDPYAAYGTWWYESYPPYYWYPNGEILEKIKDRIPQPLKNRIKNGPAWGYAWGNMDWRNGAVNLDTTRNANLNQRINRNYYNKNYQKTAQIDQTGRGTWQHNPAERMGVPYRDQATAQRYNRAASPEAIQSREAYRGRAQSTQGLNRSGTGQARQDISRSQAAERRQDIDRSPAERSEAREQLREQARDNQGQRANRDVSDRSANRGTAFQGVNNGQAVRNASNRGQMSRQSTPQAAPRPSVPQAAPRPSIPQAAPRPIGPAPGGFRGGGGRR